jgi:transposase InsO family protein
MSSKYQFVHDHASQYAVAMLCRMLGVSRSGYYAWRTRPESRHRQADRTLSGQILAIHEQSRRTYGSPRVHAELQEHGVRCSAKRVARLMRLAGIRARRPRRVQTTDSRHTFPVAENVLQRAFDAAAPNTKWAADITYISTHEGWLYLAVVMDLFSRRIIGWSMQPTLTRRLVLDALQMALDQRQPSTPVLHHSDRGSQYASDDYQRVLTTAGMACSMSRTGDCFDNAVVESFFGTLKTELVYHQQYMTRNEARSALFEYMEVFYNRQRRHSALGYRSPAAYEAHYCMQQTTAQAA